jgi:hypothetical protein
MNRSVYFFGWSTIIVSAILILSQGLSLEISSSADQITGLLGNYPGTKNGILGPMADMVAYNRIWSIYSIVYFICTLVGGVLFVRLREIGRKILEVACWIGILNACVDTTVSYVFWKDMESAMIGLTGGMGLTINQVNPLGLGAILLGFLVWTVPSMFIVRYLRKASVRSQMLLDSRKPEIKFPRPS